MPDLEFRAMSAMMALLERFRPIARRRVSTFGIEPGMVVVDYGCGPGRYTVALSEAVAETGRVYAVDIHPLAIEAVRRKSAAHALTNVTAQPVDGYASGLADHLADAVCALDMFFAVREPTTLLRELWRITKPTGRLILDDGHAPRSSTHAKLRAAGMWRIVEEQRDHLTCVPVHPA
jgi:ubiquinone/menaquinone biosynthesis C-methylase UbiE